MAELINWTINGQSSRNNAVYTSNNKIAAWGGDGYNSLGDLSNPSDPAYLTLAGGKTPQSICIASDFDTVVVCTDGTLQVAGRNMNGALGVGNSSSISSFTSVSLQNGKLAKKVVSSVYYNDVKAVYVLCTDGTVQTCGEDLLNVRNWNSINTFQHMTIFDGMTITDIAAGERGFAVITSTNKTYFIGDWGSFSSYTNLVDKSMGGTPERIFATAQKAFVIYADGTLRAMGTTSATSTGFPFASTSLSVLASVGLPTPSGQTQTPLWIAVGESHTMMVSNQGRLYATGSATYGQLGLGNTVNQSDWTEVTPLASGKTPLAVQCGKWFSTLIYTDGTVQCVGLNDFRQLGDGTTSTRYNFANITTIGGSPVVAGTTKGFGATAPGAPTAVVGTAGNQQVSVAFTQPANNGGATITSYKATASPGGAFATGASSPLVVTGLTNGTAYTFTVTATNSVGTSSASTASASVTPRTVPGAPTSVVGTAGNQQVSVAFTAPASNGGSAITRYTVTSSPGGIDVSGASSPILVTGLTNGTAYTFTVKATNIAGDSSGSIASASVTPRTVPGAPTGVSAVGANRQATVTFTAPASNGGSAITGYTATASPGGATATGASSPLTVTGLTNGTSYTFTVKATNVAGDSSGSLASSSVTPSVSVPDLNSGNISAASDDVVVAGSRTITAKKQAKSAGAVSYAPDAANKPSVAISNIPASVQDVVVGVAATDASGIAVVKIVALASNGSLVTNFVETPLTVRVTLPGFTSAIATIQTSATLGGDITDTITAYRVGTELYEFTTTHLTYFSASQYVPCFVAGTRILTAEGYKAVETLTADDLIRTADNRIVPFRMFKTHIVATSPETAPYTIPANTFGRACPATDMTISPYHAIQSGSNTWQIPKYAAQMFEGITQARSGQAITYYHLELPNYFKDNIVAEGTVVESYGNRQTAGMKAVYRLNAERTGFTRMEKTKSAKKTA